MRGALLFCAALIVAACNSTVAQSAVGEFASPTGIAATGARDRDLIFVANTGRDQLRAIQICNRSLLADGGVDPQETCSADENGQFIAAQIRVFAAGVETGEHPMRLAGARLLRPSDNSPAGVVLATSVALEASDAGVDGGVPAIAVVDARGLLDSQTTRVPPKPVQYLPVGTTPVDVVAVNQMDTLRDVETTQDAGVPVAAFVATKTELLLLQVGLDSTESAALPDIRGRCTLAPVVPTRVAVAPGDDSRAYVADGAGDGVVSIQASSLSPAGGPCTIDRISAGGRSVRALALSPPWYEQTGAGPLTHPAGELLLMVVDGLPGAQAGRPLDPGGLLFAGTGTGLVPKGVVPNPAYPLVPGAVPPVTPPEAMEPIALPGKGLFEEGVFLRAVRPRSEGPVLPDLTACPVAPCTPIYVGLPSANPTHFFNLVAAISGSDGATYFIDVPNRRFINQNLYSDLGEAAIVPIVGAITQTATGPVLEFNTDGATFEPGLVHSQDWKAIWHSPIPGLIRRGGTVEPQAGGILRFTLPPAARIPAADFSSFISDPIIALRPQDVVAFSGFTSVADESIGCKAVLNETPNRFELPIIAVAADHLDLATLPDTPTSIGFHPDCPKFGAVVEVRTAADKPWLLLGGDTLMGRTGNGLTFQVHERRFDYPHNTYSSDPAHPPFPSRANDVSYTLRISGTEPTTPGFLFSWTLDSGLLALTSRDTGTAGLLAGYATSVYSYSSPRSANLVFTSVTGVNEVLQVDPALLTTTLVYYR